MRREQIWSGTARKAADETVRQRRPPRTSDLIRWFVDAGLTPRVEISSDGTVVVEAMTLSQPLQLPTPANEMAKRIRQVGKSRDG